MKATAALAENLTRLLAEKKLSQTELGRRIDVTVQTINGLTKGKAGISADMLEKLALALDVEETELVQMPPRKVQLTLTERQFEIIERHLQDSVKALQQAENSVKKGQG